MTTPKPSTENRWGGFTIADATPLLNAHVIRKEDLSEKPALDKIGFVAGVLTLNEEIELVVKFFDGVHQYTKHEFYIQLALINE